MLYEGLNIAGVLGVLRAHGWSQVQIAAAAGLSQPTIHALATGRSRPSKGTFQKLLALAEAEAKQDKALCERLVDYLRSAE